MTILDKLSPELKLLLTRLIRANRAVGGDRTNRFSSINEEDNSLTVSDITGDYDNIISQHKDILDELKNLNLVDYSKNPGNILRYKFTPNFVKQIDPDYYIVNDLWKQVIDAVTNSPINDPRFKVARENDLNNMAYFIKNVTPSLLKNIIKSPNPGKSFGKLAAFKNDFRNKFDADLQITSLNHIDKLIEQFQEEARIIEEQREIAYYIDSLPPVKTTNGEMQLYDVDTRHGLKVTNNLTGKELTPEELEPIKQEALKNINRPYEYDPRLVKISTKHGWTPIKDPTHQRELGRSLTHCYGGCKPFGPEYHTMYRDRIRSGNTVLVNKGDITAELKLSEPYANGGREVSLGQVMLPHNKAVPEYDPNYPSALADELNKIISDYNGKTIIKPAIINGVKGPGCRC